MDFILASNSPRRRQLIALFGAPFVVVPADIDETPLLDETPSVYVARLALAKARACDHAALDTGGGEIIIAADTTVADGAEILGKPADAADARRMLRQLRGRSHSVFTAVSVLRRSDQLTLVAVCVTPVPMRAYTDSEIEDYIATGDPFDKAGAYAIQHRQFQPAPDLAGCYANVVGLPLCHLTRLLRQAGVQLRVDIAARCQEALAYACPVFAQILDGGSPALLEKS